MGRREAGKKNSGRGRSLLEQVAFKLGLERWVGFQQADVGWGRGRPGQRAGRTQKNAMLGQGKGLGWHRGQGLKTRACSKMEKGFPLSAQEFLFSDSVLCAEKYQRSAFQEC